MTWPARPLFAQGGRTVARAHAAFLDCHPAGESCRRETRATSARWCSTSRAASTSIATGSMSSNWPRTSGAGQRTPPPLSTQSACTTASPAYFHHGMPWIATGRKSLRLWQRSNSFCVIAGGPGTGKTSTVARILALLVEQAGAHPLRIGLAAPTGKATARLQEAVRTAKHQLPVDAAIRDAIPDEASTLHRLLGARPDTTTFRYHRDHPLPLDVLVIDEASMVDLASHGEACGGIARARTAHPRGRSATSSRRWRPGPC